MGKRYYITETQLGLLQTYLKNNDDTAVDLLGTIYNHQFIGDKKEFNRLFRPDNSRVKVIKNVRV